jgi:Dolichyl-phosphate-mannose-protein mannosyltransferase
VESPTNVTANRPTQSSQLSRDSDWSIPAALAFTLFLLHMLFNGRYGYFVDELYYLACSHHLAWGYVDQAPLIVVATWLERITLGDSLHALRFLPAVAAGAKVLLTGLIARELGAKRYAVALACVAVICAPLYLGIDSLLTMNAFEPCFWMACALIALKIINGASPKLWLLFGVVAGVGLQNKHSTLIFGFALFLGLLLTRERRHFAQPWIWLGGVLAFLIFLPNLLWEVHRHFPTIELLQNVQRSGRNTSDTWLSFILTQAFVMHPLSTPLWIAGLWHLLRDREGKGFRVLGWTYVIILLCLLLLHGRVYYLAPAYPMLFAAGAIAFQNWAERHSWPWMKPVYIAVLVVTAALLAPFAYFPMLTVEQYIAYSQFTHLAPPKIETHRQGPLPQLYADQFGWKEMAQVVADAYYKLPPEEQKSCAVFGQNYGQAGAIDFFGAKLGLPRAISGHQSYFYWGPREYTGACMIVLGDNYETLADKFESVEKVGTVYHPLSMPYQHFDVFLCRRPKFGTLQQVWPHLKNWG